MSEKAAVGVATVNAHGEIIEANPTGPLSEPFILGDREVRVTASAGISLGTDSRVRSELLIREADAAMYVAKRKGRNRFELADLFAS